MPYTFVYAGDILSIYLESINIKWVLNQLWLNLESIYLLKLGECILCLIFNPYRFLYIW